MSKISVTTIAGLTSGGDANKVKIESGDTLQVESNATVGGTLLVGSTSAVGNANANELELTNSAGSGTVGMTFNVNSGSADTGNIYWRSNSSNNNIQIVGDPVTNYLAFATGGVERARFSSDGLHIGGTGAANALDDYEEGTWTPSLGGNTTYTANRFGKYTKVGRFVHADFDFTVNVLGTGSASTLTGFPFPMGSYGGVMSGYCSYYTGLAVTVTYLSCYIISNTNNMYFTGHNVGAAANIGNALSVFQNSTRVLGSVAYYVAQ